MFFISRIHYIQIRRNRGIVHLGNGAARVNLILTSKHAQGNNLHYDFTTIYTWRLRNLITECVFKYKNLSKFLDVYLLYGSTMRAEQTPGIIWIYKFD